MTLMTGKRTTSPSEESFDFTAEITALPVDDSKPSHLLCDYVGLEFTTVKLTFAHKQAFNVNVEAF